MARGVNKVILVGNLGKDPEVRYTPSGSAVANVTIATSDQWKDKQTGEQQERTEWHRVVFFNRLAEVVAEYVKKGQQIRRVSGRINPARIGGPLKSLPTRCKCSVGVVVAVAVVQALEVLIRVWINQPPSKDRHLRAAKSRQTRPLKVVRSMILTTIFRFDGHLRVYL